MTAVGLMSDSRDSRPATRPSGPPLVEIRNLLVERDGRRLLDGIDLAIAPGRIVTLIGPNGAGKSTLVKAALGLVAPSAGTVVRRPGLLRLLRGLHARGHLLEEGLQLAVLPER